MNSNEFEGTMNVLGFHINDTASACGYCKKDGQKNNSSYDWGFSSEYLSPEMYERLMFCGWRRCGTYLYKKDLQKCCCKLYSMRLDVERFKINKDQRRVMLPSF